MSIWHSVRSFQLHAPFTFLIIFREILRQDFPFDRIIKMELNGKSMVSANVIYLSTILGRDEQVVAHKCDWKCVLCVFVNVENKFSELNEVILRRGNA
ncbi:uncharacterized protein LOC111449390 isoform X3 [Cucurbita moschata]|uniref:Uncharacterized protein LOC111449390 isoform X3 n=1 Tax=Cucurbita moschata TaxID=3662 RepID=A0A6J1FZN6_CUCMO|nr:uncharacterized protein LOC111449390 isoform X3 [Cucurbita moschata]